MKKAPNEATKYLYLLLKVGSIMITAILFTFSIGLYSIKTFNLSKYTLIPCILLGIGCGFYLIFKEINKIKP